MGRKSSLKTPLAVLRNELKLLQKEMAVVAGVSTHTIQSLELGRLKLSEQLAARISEKTGVSMQWLMKDKPTRPIQAIGSRKCSIVEYSRDHYNDAQARDNPTLSCEEFESMLEIHQMTLVGCFRSALQTGESNAKHCSFVVNSALEKLTEQLVSKFGTDHDYEMATLEMKLDRHSPERLQSNPEDLYDEAKLGE